MQTCDLLKHMSVEDLTQRYENTVVEYGGKWVTVTAFEKPETKVLIHWIKPNGVRTFEPFDWQKLNTERLPSRWYYRLEDGAAAFLSYIPARQWKRGYANGNTRLFHPNGAMRFRAENGEMFSKQAGNTVINRWTNADALAERLGTTDAILSEDFCMSMTGELCFRDYMIGKWKPTLRKIHLREDIFVDEMRDLGMIHLLATNKELKTIQKTDDKEKPWIKDLRGIMQEQDDRAVMNAVREEEEEEIPMVANRAERLLMNQHAIDVAGAYPQRVRENNRQLFNIRAGRNWNDNEFRVILDELAEQLREHDPNRQED